MFVVPLILAAGSLPLISGLPVPSLLSNHVEKAFSTHFLQERAASTYTVYGGNGEASNGWPSQNDWVSSFDIMFNNNIPVMKASCAQWNVPDNTDGEIKDMYSSIQSVASSTGIDARFILAIVMQESNGCVRAPTTNYGVRNPGLMQTHNGAGTCNDGSVQTPCPSKEIDQMINDGSAGTSSGDGLKQCLSQTGASDVSMYYKAARIYNSGSIAASGNLGGGIATACYATDIANRLTGWFSGPSGCEPGTIAQLNGTPTKVPTDSSHDSTNGGGAVSPTTTAGPVAAASSTSPAAVVVVSVASSSPSSAPSPIVTSPVSQPTPTPSAAAVVVATTGTSANNGGGGDSSPAKEVAQPSTAAQVYPGATTACQQWYTVQPGDYCIIVEQKFGVSLAQLMSWNSGLDAQCSNLWLAYQYCVAA